MGNFKYSGITPDAYEHAVYLRVDAALGNVFKVIKNYRIKGTEIDVAVLDYSNKLLTSIECKRKKRVIKRRHIIKYRQKLEKVGAEKGYLIARRFTDEARSEAREGSLKIGIVTFDEANKMLGIEEGVGPLHFVNYDGFTNQAINALIALLFLDDPELFIEWLEPFTFEAWGEVIDSAMAINYPAAIRALKIIARSHYEDGWRFQARERLGSAYYEDDC